jgi:uncharacterized membrane protein YfcA
VYESETDEGLERIEVEVTDEDRTVMGVDVTVVRDKVTLDGRIIEDTRDWYAQDSAGHVWYFGEATEEYDEDGSVSTAGSWEAGVDGASPGIIMYADPQVPVEALKLALVSQAVGMSSGALGWLRRGAVPRGALPVAVPMLAAGALVSSFVILPNPLLVKGLFGPVSITVGLLTLYLLEHRARTTEVPREARPGLGAVAFAGGMLTGWVAIGEGEVVAAWLMLRHGLEPRRGIALGTVLLAINSILLGGIHAFVLGGVPWELAAFVMLGCAWGGRLGPYLAQWLGPRKLKLAFATIAIGDGLQIPGQFVLSAVG